MWEIGDIREVPGGVLVKLVKSGEAHHFLLPARDRQKVLEFLALAQALQSAGQPFPEEKLNQFRTLRPILKELLVRMGFWVEKGISVRQAAQLYVAKARRAEETKRQVQKATSAWCKIVGNTPVTHIRHEDVRFYISELLRQGRSTYTVDSYCGVLCGMFNWLCRERLAPANPFRSYHVGSKVQAQFCVYVPASQIHRLCKHLRPHEAAAVALCRFQGVRISEGLRLSWQDVDFVNRHLLIVDTKRGVQRVMPLFEETIQYLVPVRRKRGPVIYPRLSRNKLKRRVDTALKAAGMLPWPRLFHSLRASCESDLVRKFALHTVCAWLGNSLRTAAKHYFMVTPSEWQLALGSSPFEEAERVLRGTSGRAIPGTFVPSGQSVLRLYAPTETPEDTGQTGTDCK